jgi:hypothetical protein
MALIPLLTRCFDPVSGGEGWPPITEVWNHSGYGAATHGRRGVVRFVSHTRERRKEVG